MKTNDTTLPTHVYCTVENCAHHTDCGCGCDLDEVRICHCGECGCPGDTETICANFEESMQ